MFSPIPHDLTIYDGKFEFEKNGFCSHQWEISVKQKNCIIWSVVLSYLKSADITVPGKFEERLNRLTKSMIDPEPAKSAILHFNPFFNKHKCFFDETLQEIVLSFKKVVEDNRPSKASKPVREDIQMISTLLKINILIVSLRSKKLYLITPSNGNCADAPAITLFCREYSNKETQVLTLRFTFCLSKDLCWELRNDAFQILLESTESRDIVYNAMQTLTEKKEKKINILIALLKKNLTREISELYDSPYTMRKLADAGFETDPRVVDVDGFSAFYYAAQSSDKSLVYILYRYAANSCNESDNTYRDPDPGIISNFSTLEEILNEDCARSKNFENLGDRAEQALLTYQHLQRFNEFLTQVSQGINEVRKRPESQLNEDLRKMDRAKKQKEIILLILDKYDAFFAVGQEEFNISEYAKHKTYYDNLDLTVALLFFDNMFLLKSRLKSPREGLYSELESSFLLSAVTKVKIQDFGFESDSGDLTIIPLLERRNLRENIKEFCSILGKKELVKEDIVDCIPKREITGMLRNFLQLKDEILISRLDHYLRTALETVEGGRKQKFVIERALQVIGESINIENEAPDSIRHLLRKCLPEDTLTVLKRTRNTLSHLESCQFPLKFKTEEDDTLFRSIQSEIRDIKEAFKEAFDIQRVRLKEFLIDIGLKSIQNIPQSAGVEVFNEDHQLVRDMENFRDSLRKRMSEFKCITNGTNGHRVSVPNINEFCRRLMGYASKSDEKQIRSEIPPEVKNREDAIQNLEEDLEGGIVIDEDKFDSLSLSSIKEEYKEYLREKFTEKKSKSQKRKKSLLSRIKNSKPLHILDMIFRKKAVSGPQLELLYNAIPFSDEAQTKLNLLIEISKEPCSDNIANLLNRIKHLYQISIDEQYDIRELYENVISSKAKQYLAYRIVQRYFRDSCFQASLEMLLLDCAAILKNNKDFKWLKDSYLFNGIDMRNVLAHGDPLLESVGDILDPKDLPSELVKKMLQLFEDQKDIEALRDLWQKAKLKERVVDSGRCVLSKIWQEYSKLLKDPKDSETYNFLVSFFQIVPDPEINLIGPFLEKVPDSEKN